MSTDTTAAGDGCTECCWKQCDAVIAVNGEDSFPKNRWDSLTGYSLQCRRMCTVWHLHATHTHKAIANCKLVGKSGLFGLRQALAVTGWLCVCWHNEVAVAERARRAPTTSVCLWIGVFSLCSLPHSTFCRCHLLLLVSLLCCSYDEVAATAPGAIKVGQMWLI